MKHDDQLRSQPSDDDPFSLTISPHRAVPRPGGPDGAGDTPFLGSGADAVRCRFCDHANPPGSMFCNSCGGQINLRPCPQCGAVMESTWGVCYRCSTKLDEARRADAGVFAGSGVPAAVPPALPAVERARAPVKLERAGLGLPLLVLAAGLAIATAGVALYYTRLQDAMDATVGAAGDRDEPSRIRPIGQPAAASAGDRSSRPATAFGAARNGSALPAAAASGCTDAVAALGLCGALPSTPRPVSHTAGARAPESTPPAAVPAAR